ncbi:DUF6301 family protein [Arthrobacter sp. AK01]|uniref:DUF6301 family protein n=1 Tax=Arthrobacter sp. AK01 TaxID=2894084 RepID=UPI001E6086A4|nr:DUF6301 family protein [Arthrobacter sp. AK01]MCD4853449.1 DUF6301 family protein [Arthrobacter sp. AK01]
MTEIVTWKSMSPAEVCDLMDFWAAAAWPLTRDEVQRLAVERYGWSIEVEDDVPYLMNTVSGFTIPDVSTIGSEGALSYISLRISDVIRRITPESTEFLGDNFALMVREGTERWGKQLMRASAGSESASWCLSSGARISLNCHPKSLSAMFQTPQGVELDRKSGN